MSERVVVIPVLLALAVPETADPQDTVAFAADAVNETLREHQRSFTPESCILDYEVCIGKIKEVPADAAQYSEGDAFMEDLT